MGRTTKFATKCVDCPYYASESPIEIKCHAKVPGIGYVGLCGDCTMNIFHDNSAKEYHKEDFCNGFFGNCPVFLAFKEGGE